MKTILSILTCLSIFTGCSAPDYSDPDQVAETYVMAVLAKDDSHKPLELDGLSPELRGYCNYGLTPDWRTNMPSDVVSAGRSDGIWKGKGPSEGIIDDYLFGMSGKRGTASKIITYIVKLRFVDGDGKEYTVAVALRPDHRDQPVTQGKVFDWESVEWKVVTR